MYRFFRENIFCKNKINTSLWIGQYLQYNRVAILLALCSAISLSSNKKMPVYEDMLKAAGTENSIGMFFAKLNFVLNQNGLLGLFLIIGLAVLYRNYFSHQVRFDKMTAVLSSLFAFIMLLGNSFKAVGSWDLLFKGKFQVFISMIYFAGYFTLFYVSLSYLLNALSNWLVTKTYTIKSYGIVDFVFNRHPFWTCWIIFLFAWSPYIVLFYPGSVYWDAFVQLQYFFGVTDFSNHHPVVSTVIMGLCVRLGQLIYSDNLGIFIYTLLQYFVFSASLACVFSYMNKLQTPILIRKIFLLFYAFWPLFPGYAQFVNKDTLYTALFVFYSIWFINLVKSPELFLLAKYKLLFALISVLLCLSRNNGIYVVLLSGIAILCLKISKKIRIQYACLLIILGGLWMVWSNCIIPGLGISKGSSKEMLSIPFQQTARYVKNYEDEVTEKEKEIINRVLDYDILSEKYNPELSDPVKDTYKSPPITDLIEYFQVWFRQFLKHPGIYLQATIHNTYSYFYPDVGSYRLFGLGFRISIEPSKKVNSGFIHVSMKDEWQPYRNAITNIMYSIQKLPGFGLLFGIGIYTWIIIFMIAYIIKIKHYQTIVVYMPDIISLLICIASPVNRYMRYYIPIITTLPLIIAYFLYIAQQKAKNS